MQKRISRHQVRLGMFIERIEGDWLNHPFWTRRFLLTEFQDLQKLMASDVRAVVIDESLGVAALPPPTAHGHEPARDAPHAEPARPQTAEAAWAEREMRQCRQAVGQLLAEARMGNGVNTKRSARIVDGITDALSRNPTALLAITRLKSVDAYTHLHSIAVSALMIHFGRHLGLPAAEVALLGQAGLLHDIGKMRLPPAVLTKTSGLTPLELEQIREHPRAGHAILTCQSGVPDLVLDVCLHHHEKLDGTGYPDRIGGEAIGRAVRISSICDVYDAVTSLRPYKKPWRPRDALRQMASWHGHFDPELLAQFADCMGFADLGADLDAPDLDAHETLVFAENAYSDPVAA